MSQLDALKEISEVVPETAALSVVKRHGARHVNLSTARITAAAQQPENEAIVDAAVLWAQRQVGKGGNRKLVAIRAVERLGLEFARALLEHVEGSVSIDVDGRLAFKRRQTIDRARAILDQLDELGVGERPRPLPHRGAAAASEDEDEREEALEQEDGSGGDEDRQAEGPPLERDGDGPADGHR